MKIKKKNVIFGDSSKNQEELFTKVEKQLFREGVVKKGFGLALIEREKEYPTGLGVNGFNIAICHTSPHYSLKNEIMLIKMADPIEFKTMDTKDDILVDYVFILVLKNGENHLNVLKKIVNIMQNSDYISKINKADNREELTIALNRAFDEDLI